VYLPPGDYTSGTIRPRSHVKLYLEAGATLYASENPNDFAVRKVKSKDAFQRMRGRETRGTSGGTAVP